MKSAISFDQRTGLTPVHQSGFILIPPSLVLPDYIKNRWEISRFLILLLVATTAGTMTVDNLKDYKR